MRNRKVTRPSFNSGIYTWMKSVQPLIPTSPVYLLLYLRVGAQTKAFLLAPDQEECNAVYRNQ
ncbi:MAG: hypothetical protein AB8H12_17550 [Lewinella sp.]